MSLVNRTCPSIWQAVQIFGQQPSSQVFKCLLKGLVSYLLCKDPSKCPRISDEGTSCSAAAGWWNPPLRLTSCNTGGSSPSRRTVDPRWIASSSASSSNITPRRLECIFFGVPSLSSSTFFFSTTQRDFVVVRGRKEKMNSCRTLLSTAEYTTQRWVADRALDIVTQVITHQVHVSRNNNHIEYSTKHYYIDEFIGSLRTSVGEGSAEQVRPYTTTARRRMDFFLLLGCTFFLLLPICVFFFSSPSSAEGGDRKKRGEEEEEGYNLDLVVHYQKKRRGGAAQRETYLYLQPWCLEREIFLLHFILIYLCINLAL